MGTIIYYCRKCGNYTYFKFYSKYVYLASLRGLSYANITSVKLSVEKVVCQVCGSEDVDTIFIKYASDVPNLMQYSLLKPEDRIKAFDRLKENLKEKYGEEYGSE